MKDIIGIYIKLSPAVLLPFRHVYIAYIYFLFRLHEAYSFDCFYTLNSSLSICVCISNIYFFLVCNLRIGAYGTFGFSISYFPSSFDLYDEYCCSFLFSVAFSNGYLNIIPNLSILSVGFLNH